MLCGLGAGVVDVKSPGACRGMFRWLGKKSKKCKKITNTTRIRQNNLCGFCTSAKLGW